jgi:hypothetical protein
MDTISWFLATMHQFLGHDKTAGYIGAAAGDKRDCILCWFEAGQASREQVEAYFTAVEKWNAAVDAANADPTPENIAKRDRLREKFLTGVHLRVMQEDDYQDRTH